MLIGGSQPFHRPQHAATAEMEGSYTERYRIIEPFSTTLDEVEGSYSGSSGRELSIGEGAYGKVYKAKDICTNRTVALKKIKCECCEGHEGVAPSTLREVTLLLRLRHENVVQLLDVRMCDNSQRLVMVFELLETDLYRYMRSSGGSQGHAAPLEKSTLHSFSAQLLEGIAFCHSMGVIHRDLKPHNILVDSRGQLKIADFGLARTFTPQQASMTVQVVTRYYRSPELLLGHKQYGFGVDVWSVACIIAEMASGRILFRGDCDIDQLHRIFRLLGTPHALSSGEANVASFRSISMSCERNLPRGNEPSKEYANDWHVIRTMPYWSDSFPQWVPIAWEKILTTNMNSLGIDLLSKMLQYNINTRISAHAALKHPFIAPHRSSALIAAQRIREEVMEKISQRFVTPTQITSLAHPVLQKTFRVASGQPYQPTTDQEVTSLVQSDLCGESQLSRKRKRNLSEETDEATALKSKCLSSRSRITSWDSSLE